MGKWSDTNLYRLFFSSSIYFDLALQTSFTVIVYEEYAFDFLWEMSPLNVGTQHWHAACSQMRKKVNQALNQNKIKQTNFDIDSESIQQVQSILYRTVAISDEANMYIDEKSVTFSWNQEHRLSERGKHRFEHSTHIHLRIRYRNKKSNNNKIIMWAIFSLSLSLLLSPSFPLGRYSNDFWHAINTAAFRISFCFLWFNLFLIYWRNWI